MTIYEVNISVESAVADEYHRWLQEHVRQILALDGFRHALILEDEDEELDRRRYTMHYYLTDRESLDSYFLHHADAMRRDGMARFPGQFTATRRVLAVIDEIVP